MYAPVKCPYRRLWSGSSWLRAAEDTPCLCTVLIAPHSCTYFWCCITNKVPLWMYGEAPRMWHSCPPPHDTRVRVTRSPSQCNATLQRPHAKLSQSFLIEFSRTAAGSDEEPPRVLLDPIFSHGIGPLPWLTIRRRLPLLHTRRTTRIPICGILPFSNQCVVCQGDPS
jgi:hypothetical protein